MLQQNVVQVRSRKRMVVPGCKRTKITLRLILLGGVMWAVLFSSLYAVCPETTDLLSMMTYT